MFLICTRIKQNGVTISNRIMNHTIKVISTVKTPFWNCFCSLWKPFHNPNLEWILSLSRSQTWSHWPGLSLESWAGCYCRVISSIIKSDHGLPFIVFLSIDQVVCLSVCLYAYCVCKSIGDVFNSTTASAQHLLMIVRFLVKYENTPLKRCCTDIP